MVANSHRRHGISNLAQIAGSLVACVPWAAGYTVVCVHVRATCGVISPYSGLEWSVISKDFRRELRTGCGLEVKKDHVFMLPRLKGKHYKEIHYPQSIDHLVSIYQLVSGKITTSRWYMSKRLGFMQSEERKGDYSFVCLQGDIHKP